MNRRHPAMTVDGNAIAGQVLDILGIDVTALHGTCDGCGCDACLAEAVVEIDTSAAIVRCRTCTRTLFTVLHADPTPRLVFGSLRSLSG
ncbi:DUF6510 family protein [Microbacterium sp. 1.5R]|uniref:DUF6510 family protein n=1 Tax=Microbacterium sp. 1.5R TaxID=1916917 RepID=UPI00119DDA85|nr:DUF6510 family protein [Microbacterium sp. 1.5R]